MGDEIWSLSQIGRVPPDEVLRYLRDASFPATRDDLILHAERRGAPVGVLAFLEEMVRERFERLEDVRAALDEVMPAVAEVRRALEEGE